MVMLGFCFVPKSSKEAFSIADAPFFVERQFL